MTCEAGVVLANAQEAAAEADRLFPLSLGAEGSCTIGGNLSTNAGGTGALAYGVARDLVLGLEVVLADGRVLNGLRKLKKDNTGYDLKNLFVGAEGTLGIITAAVLKLFPRPRAVETAFVGVPSPQAALALLNLAQRARRRRRDELRADRRACARIRAQARRRRAAIRCATPHPWYVLIEIVVAGARGLARDRSRTSSATALERGLVDGRDDRREPRAGARRSGACATLLAEVQKPEGGSIKHDVSVPVAAVPDFIARGDRGRARRSSRAAGRCRSAISATATSTSTSPSRSAPTRRRSSSAGTR